MNSGMRFGFGCPASSAGGSHPCVRRERRAAIRFRARDQIFDEMRTVSGGVSRGSPRAAPGGRLSTALSVARRRAMSPPMRASARCAFVTSTSMRTALCDPEPPVV